MTNNDIIIITLRIAGILLFLNIFDHITAYITTYIITTTIPSMKDNIYTGFAGFYYTGIILMILQMTFSFLFFFKPGIIVNALLKQEKTMNINCTPFQLLKVLLLTLGIYWLAISIATLPEQLNHIYNTLFNENKIASNSSRENPIKYIFRLIISLTLLFFAHRISYYLYLKK